jgi:phosphoenolpyruvate-protein kinase (PTS system EI component)
MAFHEIRPRSARETNGSGTRTFEEIPDSLQLADGVLHFNRRLLGLDDASIDSEPCVTQEGIPISVLANVTCSKETERAVRCGADGIGLYPIERAYLAGISSPSSAELAREMRQTLKAAQGLPVCIRLLSFGTHKPLPFLRFVARSSPQLRKRGLHSLDDYPELLRTSLKAILELANDFDIRILIPGVTQLADVLVVQETLAELATEMQVSTLPRLGATIETAAAVYSAREISMQADFLNFGSDLTQRSFSEDRDHAAVDRYFDDAADAIFRLLMITHSEVPDIPLSVAGRLPARPELVPRILQCGVRSLSVAPILVPMIKESIRNSWCTAPNGPEHPPTAEILLIDRTGTNGRSQHPTQDP